MDMVRPGNCEYRGAGRRQTDVVIHNETRLVTKGYVRGPRASRDAFARKCTFRFLYSTSQQEHA